MLRVALRADVNRLARLLRAYGRAGGYDALPTRTELGNAIEQFLAAFPVYRGYIDARGVQAEDRALIEQSDARGLLREALLRGEPLDFVQRLQQTSGAATAKGVEDTGLYDYVPLVSLIEVGGTPDRPLADAVNVLHRANGERATRWPHTLLATSTHDTKRSADVRARLDALSEIPDEWTRVTTRWRHMTMRHRGRAGRRMVPDPNTEYLLYQSLLGIWPLAHGAAVPPQCELDRLRDRVTPYLVKAVREGKQRSTWTETDQRYESALELFIASLLDGERSATWLGEMAAFAHRIARPGMWTSLSRVLLHLTSPGTPDIYQGDELWCFTMVDPDNRRPVDFAARERMLAEIDASPDVRSMMDAPEDGRIKLYVTSRLLRARRRFTDGGYRPLEVEGAMQRHLIAFARGAAIALAPRLVLTLAPDGSAPLGARVWRDTTVRVASDCRWRCVLSGRVLQARDGLRVADVLDELPVALLLPDAA
jgi:(1->4)-alpha-D-glucan 1-alpha-D-glucosylmutase